MIGKFLESNHKQPQVVDTSAIAILYSNDRLNNLRLLFF